MTISIIHRRGDTFDYSLTLTSPWTFATFTGGMKCTIRTALPESSEVTDSAAMAQATTTAGGITGADAVVRIVFPASVTNLWTVGSHYIDLQGTISGATPLVYTVDSGTIYVTADVTRSG